MLSKVPAGEGAKSRTSADQFGEPASPTGRSASGSGPPLQRLGDLHSIQCRTLLQLVSDQPEGQPWIKDASKSNPPHCHFIAARVVARHRVEVGCRLIEQLDTGSLGKQILGFGHRQRLI